MGSRAANLNGLLVHELTGPIAALGSVAERAIDEAARVAEGPEARKRLAALREEAWIRRAAIGRIVRLVSLADPGRDAELRLEPRLTGISTMIKRAIDGLRRAQRLEKGRSRPVEFELFRSASSLPAMAVDESLIHCALENLLLNAVKYSLPPGDGGPMRVAISGEVEGSFVVIGIRNWGLGIADKELETVFEPWVNGAADIRAPLPHGLGLGLFVTRRAIHAHGGTIRVQSTPTLTDPKRIARLEGFETTFEIRLPREPKMKPR